MKKCFVFLALFLPLCGMAQQAEDAETDYLSRLPVRDGKVVFSDTLALPAGKTKSEIRNMLSSVLGQYLKDKRGFVKLNDTISNRLVVQVFNYMEVEKRALSLFAMWAKYNLTVDYSGDNCLMEIDNIVLIEPDSENAGKILARKRDISDSANDGSFSAEDVFLKKRYKVAFVSNAANKTAGHFIADVEKLRLLLEKELNK
ncbi:MAG: hypothetical protein LBR34_02290 [Prevotella sp.]|jgi:hypothetical protein|nr:hypothetical protein [Prevotella sp.]